VTLSHHDDAIVYPRHRRNITPVSHAVGEVFLSCVDTEYYLRGSPLDAAALLDGRQPGQVLGPIPGTQRDARTVSHIQRQPNTGWSRRNTRDRRSDSVRTWSAHGG